MFRLRYLLLLLLIAYLLTGIAQVGPEERGVVRRFGKVVARPGPGLWVGLPWSIDRVDRVPVRARQLTVGYDLETPIENVVETPAGQFLTGDQNLVNVQLVIDYAIGESDRDLDDYVMHRDQVDAVLSRVAEAVASEWTAGRGVDQVLLTGNAGLPAWVMERVGERLPAWRLGIRLQRVSVGYLAPGGGQEVRAAFEAVTQAQTGIRTRETQARQEASQRERQAEALKYQLEQQAAQYRDEQREQATADANAFLRELAAYREVAKTNPDALAFVWWVEMSKALAILEARGGKVKPLDHYLQSGELNLTEFLNLPQKK